MTVLAPMRALPAGTTDAVMARLFPQPHPYAHDPVGYARDVLGFEPWSKQRQVLESVRDHRRTAVRSGQGLGKTSGAAVAVIWFHDCFPDSRVISTAPTFEPGVKDLLWRDVRALCARAGDRIRSKVLDTRLERGEKWFAAGYSTDKPERFAGHHAEHVLYVVDEASGVDERIFEAGEGFLTSEHARVLLIGNPTQTSGQFYRAFHSERSDWATIAVSCLDSPAFTGEPVSEAARRGLVTRDWVEERRQLWGEDSPAYHVRVLGEFPAASDDTVCPLSTVEAAQARRLEPGEPVVVGCDVARFGSDETVISVRHGNRVRVARRRSGQNLMATVGDVLEVARGTGHPPTLLRIVVDDPGVGGGVTDRLVEVGEFPVVAFRGGDASFSGDYPNRRSELWFSFASRLGEVDLDPDEQLAADLVAPRYSLDSRGRRVVEPKSETKKRLGRSPDRADSVMLTFAVPDAPAVGYAPRADLSITAGLMGRQW